jgi:hypothetical protein
VLRGTPCIGPVLEPTAWYASLQAPARGLFWKPLLGAEFASPCLGPVLDALAWGPVWKLVGPVLEALTWGLLWKPLLEACVGNPYLGSSWEGPA